MRLGRLDRVVVRAVRILDERPLVALAPVVFVLPLSWLPDSAIPTLKKSLYGARRSASAVMNCRRNGPTSPPCRCRSTETSSPAPSSGDLIGKRVVPSHRAIVSVGEGLDRFGVPVPSILTTTKPSSARAWRSPRAAENAREPTLPDCGPG